MRLLSSMLLVLTLGACVEDHGDSGAKRGTGGTISAAQTAFEDLAACLVSPTVVRFTSLDCKNDTTFDVEQVRGFLQDLEARKPGNYVVETYEHCYSLDYAETQLLVVSPDGDVDRATRVTTHGEDDPEDPEPPPSTVYSTSRCTLLPPDTFQTCLTDLSSGGGTGGAGGDTGYDPNCVLRWFESCVAAPVACQ